MGCARGININICFGHVISVILEKWKREEIIAMQIHFYIETGCGRD